MAIREHIDEDRAMSETHLKNVIEAALLAAARPLALPELAQLFDEPQRPEIAAIRAAIAALVQDYAERGIEIQETANGFRIQVRAVLAPQISRLWPERPQRYSRALLETLALIAYRQPITRAEIESVRGVTVNPNILRTLMERSWIRVVGHRDVPGHPELLGTTREFLDYFGLKSLDQLPALAELKAMADLHPQLDLPGTLGARDGRDGAADGPYLEGADALESLSAPAIPASVGVADSGDDEASEDDELSASTDSSAGLVAAPPPRAD
jgi:segregation and condensation protein B